MISYYRITLILIFLTIFSIKIFSAASADYDTSLACNACHFASKYTMHPVNISMKDSGLRTTLPLFDDKITCLTCHKYHTDDPYARQKKQDTTYTFLLRIPNLPVSSLCVNCHDDKKFVIGTDHDMKVTAPDEKNILEQTTGKMGPCSSCHLAHNGQTVKLWAKNFYIAEDILTMLCKSCHNENGCAKSKNLNNFSHPLNIEVLKKGLTTTLPLYDDDGKPKYEGKINCATCHNIHIWSPDEKKPGINKNEDGIGKNSFLRINNQLNSALCVNCHKTQGFIIGSPHDMFEIAFNEKNIRGKSSGDSGQCSACHLVHNAKDKENFAREYGPEDDTIAKKCTSCHISGKIAEKKLIGNNYHPINLALASWKMTTSLPLFGRDGKISSKGMIKCTTCHNVHQWSPDKSKLGREVKKEKIKLDKTMLQNGTIGEIIFIKGKNVYVDHQNMKIEVKKDNLLSIFADGEIIGKIKVLNYNPFAKESEIFALIISEENIEKIKKGDIVFNLQLLNISLSGSITGDGTNSFLNMTNSNSELCLDCHKDKETILKTKHDLFLNYPNYVNLKGEKVSLSGPCSACHSPHNAEIVYLFTLNIARQENLDNITKSCNFCHRPGGAASTKVLSAHHSTKLFPPSNIELTPPPTFMALYDIDGNIGFWDYVSCATCHDVHQWDPEEPKNREIAEGDNLNSFLRIKNDEKQLCEACHLRELNIKMIRDKEKKEEEGKKSAYIHLDDEKSDTTFIISSSGPKIEITSPKKNSVLTKYEEIISGNIDDQSLTRALVLINGKPNVISVLDGQFTEQVVFIDGKNIIRVLATNMDGKSGSSDELIVTVDTRKPKIIAYEYQKPVTLTDEFQMKIIFDQPMDNNVAPFIYIVTSAQKTIVLETQISAQGNFFGRFEQVPLFEQQVFNDIKQGEILMNSKEYFGYESKPQILIKDSGKNKIPGAGNDEIIIKASSANEPEGEFYTLKELITHPGVFLGEIEFGRWVDPGDKLITVENKDNFTVTYNFIEYNSTYINNDTLLTPPLKITREMKGATRIIIENARGLNGNIIDREDKETFFINPDLFYIKNKNPVYIEEGEITRIININLNITVPQATKMIISENADFTGAKWEQYQDKKNFILSSKAGIKTLYLKFKNSFNAESEVFTVKINFIPIQYNAILNKDIKQNVILTQSMGPFLIQKSFKIEPDATLQIEQGTQFWVDATSQKNIKISVLGKLIANGTEEDKISFNSNSVKPKSGDWEGIEILNSEENSLKYINIENANRGLVLIGSNAKIENARFENNISGLICNNHSNPDISFCEFRKNNVGVIAINFSSPEINNSYFSFNEIGIQCESVSSPKITNNSIIKNTQIGIKCIEMSSPPISDNDISQNVEYGIYINRSSPMIFKNNITENMTGIYCEEFYSPFLVKNNNILNNKEYAFKLSKFDQNLDVSKNWWGVLNTVIISKFVYDYFDDNALGKLILAPIMESPVVLRNLSIVTDTIPPILLTSEYQNPANITTHFQISFIFSEPCNPFILPKVTLVNKRQKAEGKRQKEEEKEKGNEIEIAPGRFSFVRAENDTYITPDITLDENMTGEIEIYIENVLDLTGNKMDKIFVGKFILNTALLVKEGDYISNQEITLLIKAPEADNMIIGEDPNFQGKNFEPFSNEKKINLSSTEGKKNIYFRTRSKSGVLSATSQFAVNLDKTPPRIINQIYNIPKIKEPFKIKLLFNEPINTSVKPKITLKNMSKETLTLPDGNISSTTLMNDTYITSPIILPEKLEGYISVLVEEVKDTAGNIMDPTTMNNLFRYDIVPPSPHVKVEGGNYTIKNDIILLFDEQKDRKNVEMILSEDKNFKNAKWEILKKEHGFKLSSGEGEKDIYIQFRDKIGYISEVQKITVFIDKIPPKIINYFYPSPIKVGESSQIKVQFNESLDTTYFPEISMVSTGEKSPEMSGEGSFMTIRFPNDTFASPPVIFDESMGGAITIIVKNAIDLAKNEMELDMKKSFNFDTYAPVATQIAVKEGLFVRNPKINFSISVVGALKMMLSEDVDFKNTKWEDYASDLEFNLSQEDGVKKIYFKFEDENKNISKPQRVEVTLDRNKPVITAFDFPPKVEFNKPFNITIHFSEEVKSEKPAIVLMSSSHLNYLIANEGTFASDKNKNDTYITPEIILDESMKGAIIFVMDQVIDPTGNKMDTFSKLLFYAGEEDPRQKKIKVKEGDYTKREDITLLFNIKDADEIKISEDSGYKSGKWSKYSEKVRYTLKGTQGEKYLYISVKYKDGKIENSNIKVYLDKTQPVIVKSIFPEDDINLAAQIKIIFNESLDNNFIPSIVVSDVKGENVLLTEEGTFTTTNKKNDTYITPVIPRYGKLLQPIDLSITKVQDLAGNVMGLSHVSSR